MRFHVKVSGNFSVPHHLRRLIQIHTVGRAMVVAGGLVFLIADGLEKQRVP
jgi:hypothetical protein